MKKAVYIKKSLLLSALVLPALTLPVLAQDMGTMPTDNGTMSTDSSMATTTTTTGPMTMRQSVMAGMSPADQMTLTRGMSGLTLSQQVVLLKSMYTMAPDARTGLVASLAGGSTLVADAGGMVMMRDAAGTMTPLPMGTMTMATGAMPMNAMPMSGLMASMPLDALFVTRAAEGNLAEVTISQLALKKTRNASVRQIAQMLISEHGMANQQLLPIAAQKGVPTPPMLGATNTAVYQTLSKLSGAAFDRMFMAGQTEAHENAIALYMQEIAAGQDADVKGFATRLLPRIIQHTAMIMNVAKQVGAPGSELRPATLPAAMMTAAGTMGVNVEGMSTSGAMTGMMNTPMSMGTGSTDGTMVTGDTMNNAGGTAGGTGTAGGAQ